jgi:hypothetical protein
MITLIKLLKRALNLFKITKLIVEKKITETVNIFLTLKKALLIHDSRRGVLDTTLSLSVTEILLKVALNTISLTPYGL